MAKKTVTVRKATRDAAVKRAVLGASGVMKLTANQRRSLAAAVESGKTMPTPIVEAAAQAGK